MDEEGFLRQLAVMTADQLVVIYKDAQHLAGDPNLVQVRNSQIIQQMQQFIYDNGGEGFDRFTAATGCTFRSYGENICESG